MLMVVSGKLLVMTIACCEFIILCWDFMAMIILLYCSHGKLRDLSHAKVTLSLIVSKNRNSQE